MSAQESAKEGTPFRWTAAKARAAVLLAEDERTDVEIAAEAGVHVATLWRWRQHPDFAARVGDHVGRLQAGMLRYRIAKKRERMRVYDGMLSDALEIVASRKRRYTAELTAQAKVTPIRDGVDEEDIRTRVVPDEAATGWIVETEKVNAIGIRTTEWAFDGGLWRAVESVSEQAARELGQWVEKAEIGGMTTVVEIVGVDAGLL